MLGLYSPEKLDIVIDNPTLSFPRNVEYHFIFELHEKATIPAVIDIIRECDVYALECPAAYNPNKLQDIKRAVSIGSRIMQGTVSADDDEWLNKFCFSSSHDNDAKDASVINFYREMDCYRDTGIIFEPIDTISSDPEPEKSLVVDDYGTPYEDNVLWLFSTAPVRESLMLRQIAKIGADQSCARDHTKIGIVCGAMHWPLAVAARHLGASVTKSYVDGHAKRAAVDQSDLPYFRERFSGTRVQSSVDFLNRIYPSYKGIIREAQRVELMSLLEN